jgi:hypothetical protein
MWWDKETTTAAPTVSQGTYTEIDTTTAELPWALNGITWTAPNAAPTWTVTTPNIVPTWTTTNTGTGGWGVGGGGAGYHINQPLKGGSLHLEGDDADININGKSLMAILRSLEQRLNILRPNTELEAEWDQLRELGEQYRRLEKEFEEKSKMWNNLKEIQSPTP